MRPAAASGLRTAAAFPAKNARAKRSAFERWFSEGAAFSARRISHAAFATGRIELAAGATHGDGGNGSGRSATGFFLAGESRRSGSGRPERRGGLLGEMIAPMMPANEAAWSGNLPGERGSNGGATASGTREFERMYEERKAANGFPADREPVRMVHHPNPYADAPSLYDLYVQASWPASGATRFGAEVFRRGAVNSEALPMDLPVGPDYVLGPGDSLSIDLWGGSVAAVVSCSGLRRAIGASG